MVSCACTLFQLPIQCLFELLVLVVSWCVVVKNDAKDSLALPKSLALFLLTVDVTDFPISASPTASKRHPTFFAEAGESIGSPRATASRWVKQGNNAQANKSKKEGLLQI